MNAGDWGAIGAAAACLIVVVWLARELALAHRWRRLLEALERLCDALERLDVVEIEPDDEGDR